jgi:hypothetical protein
MNYTKIYNNLVSKRQLNVLGNAGEVHHIVPKCLGGDNSKDNLVKLAYREHFIAHRLLAKIHKENAGLQTAVYLMTMHSKYTSGRVYARLREDCISYVKGKTYEELYGEEKALAIKSVRKEHLEKLQSKGLMTSKGENNPMHRSTSGKGDEFYTEKSKLAYVTRRKNGTDKHTEETKAKIRNSCKDLNKKPVNLLDDNGNVLKTFSSVSEAAQGIGVSGSAISTAINHRNGILARKKLRVSYE